jgi:hypothetical protein
VERLFEYFVLLSRKGLKTVTDILLWINSVLKNIVSCIYITVITYHTPIFWSWTGTSEVFLRLVLLQHVLFCALICPLRWNQASLAKNVGFGSWTLSCTVRKKKVTKLRSSLIFTFQLLEPVLLNMALVSTAFCLVYFLSKKDPVECTFLTNSKTIYEAGTWTPEYLQQNFFTRFIRSIFHMTCHIQKSIVEVYISPSLLL